MTTKGDKPSGEMPDMKFLRKVVHLFEESRLHEMEWSNGESRIRLVREPEPGRIVHLLPAEQPAKSSAASGGGPSAPSPEADESQHKLASPLVGTFYRSPAPDAPPYVDVGDRVRKGQIVCIVEAMKVMNEVECDRDGVVTAVVAENAQPVEYGETLFLIRPE